MARRNLYRGQPTTTAAAVYTSSNIYTTITAASACNTTASAVEIDIWRVPNGGTASDANKIYEDLSVPPNGQLGLQLLIQKTLAKDEELHVQAGTGAAVTLDIDGDQHS